LALRVFTAEFGMGSGVFTLAMTTRPRKDQSQGSGIGEEIFHAGFAAACDRFTVG
jgi:hypothetical protein